MHACISSNYWENETFFVISQVEPSNSPHPVVGNKMHGIVSWLVEAFGDPLTQSDLPDVRAESHVSVTET